MFLMSCMYYNEITDCLKKNDVHDMQKKRIRNQNDNTC